MSSKRSKGMTGSPRKHSSMLIVGRTEARLFGIPLENFNMKEEVGAVRCQIREDKLLKPSSNEKSLLWCAESSEPVIYG